MMRGANFLVCVAAAMIFITIWSIINRPEVEPAWPERIQGFSFSPMQASNDPAQHNLPTEAEIDRDLQLLAGKTNAIRTYSVDGVLARIPSMARKYGLNVTLGIWLDDDEKSNEEQIATAIRLARENYRNVIRVIVGNEVLYRNDMSIGKLAGYLKRVREALDIPVSTAEPWHIWLKHPELVESVDFLGVHMLPYWEGVQLDDAVDHVVSSVGMLSRRYPGVPVVIAEVGWPSNGRTRKAAVASPANQAVFLRRFLQRAEEIGFVYYVMEAFDQTWKSRNMEGAVGAYWGVYDVKRQPKFPLSSPIVKVPEWHYLAGCSVLFAAIVFMLLVADGSTLKVRGRSFLASIAFGAATAAVWIVYSYFQQYLTPVAILIGIVMAIGLVGVFVVILAESHEWAEALWKTGERRFDSTGISTHYAPFVSIHVPAYNEPPEMLIETLTALSRLQYPHYEVIVMDNNTRDPQVWQPVAECCRRLGSRFRFFHEGELAGFKAGALNYALTRSAREAEIIAVIDSDYVVHPNWLSDLLPYFQRRKIAIVQAPQDYRDDRENIFKAMCYAEYSGFFNIGMIVRNERNAIIQHGTMTMVRRSVLEEVGGWAEWCITEDAELGLRILAKGYEAQYVARCYGKGLMPDSFVDFKKQRFRWAYGAVQIMRRHWRILAQRKHGLLTHGQRYHFLAGWLPWLADSINLLFTLGALAWSLGMVISPERFDPPMLMLSTVPLSFFLFKMAKMFSLYQQRVCASFTQTASSVIAGLSLTHTIAKAMLYGFVTRELPFFRTPKRAGRSGIAYAVSACREELLVALALLLAAFVVHRHHPSPSPDLQVWCLVLTVQSVPYVAAVAMSFICGLAGAPARLKAFFLGKPAIVTADPLMSSEGPVERRGGLPR